MANAGGGGFAVAGEPSDRADGAGDEEEAVGIAARGGFGNNFSQSSGDGEAREIVVGKRGMARVAGDEDFISGLAGNQKFAVGEATVGESGVDANFIVGIGERTELIVGKAEAPVFLVVGSAIRNPVGVIGKSEEMRAKLA